MNNRSSFGHGAWSSWLS